MQDALNVDPEVLIETLSKSEKGSEEKAVFQLDSFVFREEGDLTPEMGHIKTEVRKVLVG